MDRRRKWSIGIAALIIAAALGAAGCGNGNGDEGSASSASTNGGQAGQKGQSGQASQAASAESPKPDAGLRKVKDAKGETEIPAKPQRIVDISGASEIWRCSALSRSARPTRTVSSRDRCRLT